MFYIQLDQIPLHRAAEVGHIDIAMHLISSGAEVNLKNGVGGSTFKFGSKRPFRLIYRIKGSVI